MNKIKSIYIIDDDPITVFGMQKILQSVVDCDEIRTFAHGKLAFDYILEQVETNQSIPEVIFLDINMPIMDGWQFLEEFIRLQIETSIRINIVTSSIDHVDSENWERYKAKTHHTITFNNKPLRRENLAEITTAA